MMTVQLLLWIAQATWFGALAYWHWHLLRWHRALHDFEGVFRDALRR